MPERTEQDHPVDDLVPFVSHLVTVPGVTREPIPLDHLVTELLPYRLHRRALGVVSLDQYEARLLRLCAGEGGYARLLPPELSEACRGALAGPDPGLSSVPGLAGGRLVLLDRAWDIRNGLREPAAPPPAPEPGPQHDAAEPPRPPAEPTPVAEATPVITPLNERPERTVAPAVVPREPVAPPEPGPRDRSSLAPDHRSTPSICPSCRFVLPDLDTLRFCPGCGAGVAPAGCPGCGETVLPAWRHCPSCGHRLGSTGLA